MLDYMSITKEQIASLISENAKDFGIDSISESDVMKDGMAIIERDPYGFAVIYCYSFANTLSFFWIDPAARRMGRGRQFLRALVKKYTTEHPLHFQCFGLDRWQFYAACGAKFAHSTSRENISAESEGGQP